MNFAPAAASSANLVLLKTEQLLSRHIMRQAKRRLTINNTMIQWVTENTRHKGEDKLSRLDLLFTKRINLEKILIMSASLEGVTMWSWKLRLRKIWKTNRRNHTKRKEEIMQKQTML